MEKEVLARVEEATVGRAREEDKEEDRNRNREASSSRSSSYREEVVSLITLNIISSVFLLDRPRLAKNSEECKVLGKKRSSFKISAPPLWTASTNAGFELNSSANVSSSREEGFLLPVDVAEEAAAAAGGGGNAFQHRTSPQADPQGDLASTP
eukprot:CAMPEP_0117865542 /NCGR_PEP_ID=MMETSP0950-20121206/6800_1 /TAXON_ID=44440 /ORGANISM="Chattonella subsalsa, Strain CCMP2191" /LENGTH=152 /DNA_ID=CAMNT_0005716645 /DNA_START=252 /DNA_END=707 /DNA_ORIENTATION=+